MKAEDKAYELVDKYLGQYPMTYSKQGNVFIKEAKQCALICVDELIHSTQPKSRMFRYDKYCIEYWQEVKQEINLL